MLFHADRYLSVKSQPLPRARIAMDIALLVIAGLLAATLIAFFAGLFPYPYGLVVLVALLVARILTIRSRGP